MKITYDDYKACYHEAGHAVVADVLNFWVVAIGVKADGSGLVTTRRKIYDALPSAFDQFVYTAAGLEAVALRFPHRKWDEVFSGFMGDAKELRVFCFSREMEQLGHQTARRILKIHWKSVESIALRLRAVGRIEGDELDDLLGKEKPKSLNAVTEARRL